MSEQSRAVEFGLPRFVIRGSRKLQLQHARNVRDFIQHEHEISHRILKGCLSAIAFQSLAWLCTQLATVVDTLTNSQTLTLSGNDALTALPLFSSLNSDLVVIYISV